MVVAQERQLAPEAMGPGHGEHPDGAFLVFSRNRRAKMVPDPILLQPPPR
jgi:hypothetical protein